MAGAAVALVVTASDPGCGQAARALFAAAEHHVFSHRELRPSEPFEGPLFRLLAAQPRGDCIGLLVPVGWHDTAPGGAEAVGAQPGLVAVADHVNLALCSPLDGRWPPGVPRSFPPLAGIYQPGVVRARGGARVYSAGVVVAGVADAGRLTPFEARVVAEQGVRAVSDVLVPSVIVSAYYGLTLAVCGVPQADDRDNK